MDRFRHTKIFFGRL